MNTIRLFPILFGRFVVRSFPSSNPTFSLFSVISYSIGDWCQIKIVQQQKSKVSNWKMQGKMIDWSFWWSFGRWLFQLSPFLSRTTYDHSDFDWGVQFGSNDSMVLTRAAWHFLCRKKKQSNIENWALRSCHYHEIQTERREKIRWSQSIEAWMKLLIKSMRMNLNSILNDNLLEMKEALRIFSLSVSLFLSSSRTFSHLVVIAIHSIDCS